MGGWGGAANELGMGTASGQGTSTSGFKETVTPDEVSFLISNPVPYAFFVEVVGPGFPPRGGVFMVTRSSFETLPDFEREIQAAWARIP